MLIVKLKIYLQKFKSPNLNENKNIIIDPRLAYQITSMMEGVIKRYSKKTANLDVPMLERQVLQTKIRTHGSMVSPRFGNWSICWI